MIKILTKGTYNNMLSYSEALETKLASIDNIYKGILEGHTKEVVDSVEEAYIDYKGIAKKAFNKSEKAFLTLGDNLFYLAAREKPELLDIMKKQIEVLQVKHIKA